MHPEDLANLNSTDRERLRLLCKGDNYFFGKAILKYTKLVPHVHREPADWFSNYPEIKRKGHLAPRDHYKSTLDTIVDSIRRIIIKPDIRILIINEVIGNAQLMVGSIKYHFDNNVFFKNLFPEVIPKKKRETTWSNSALLIPRDAPWTEPTVSPIGTGGAVVSKHFDILKFDDFIGLEAKDSKVVMNRAIRYLTYAIPALFVEPEESEAHIAGTRWKHDDAIQFAMDKMGFEFLIQKAVVYNNETGQPEPLFPELISLKTLRQILEADPDMYATHYANDPFDSSDMDFKASDIIYYNVGPDKMVRFTDPSTGMLRIVDPEAMMIYTHVDPALAEEDVNDPVAIITVGIIPGPFIFILEAFKKRIDPVQTVAKMMQIQETWQPEKFTVEHVGYQKALKYFAEDEARRRGIYLRIEPSIPPRNKAKHKRIKGRLQPFMAVKSILFRNDQFNVIEEILKFGHTEEDHLLDALAQGPEVWEEPLDDRMLVRMMKNKESLMKPRGVTGYGV